MGIGAASFGVAGWTPLAQALVYNGRKQLSPKWRTLFSPRCAARKPNRIGGTMKRFKRVIALLTTVCLFALIGCASSQSSSTSAASSSQSAPAKLAIIHTNDVHGYIQAGDKCLGLAAVAQLKADYEANGYDVLLLDAGDALQGNILTDDSKGAVIPVLMNACGYDAMALGNHEFDYGTDVLQERIAACNFPVLAANITIDATGKPFAQANTVFTLSDGTKVGVFAIDTPEAQTKSAPKNTVGLTFAQGESLYACVQEQIDELRAQDCELIVCLGHLGEEDPSQPNRAKDVIEHTDGINLFINAHDHAVENAIVQDRGKNSVLVVETGCYLANIGVATYENGVFSETLVAAGSYEGSNADIASEINKISSDIDARMSAVVATSAYDLDGNKAPGVRDRETALGNLVADAVRWEATQALGTQPDCALVNGGGIRTSLAAGDITLRNVHDVLPFSNQVYTLQVTGAQLLEALEAATQGSPEAMGSFPQVSGITFTLDVSVPYEKGAQYPYSTYYAPANPGARVHITDVNGKGFDLNETYTLATIDFVATGGDTYYCFAEASQKGMETTGYTLFQSVQYYLSDECGGVVPDQYAQTQGRVTVLGQ